MKIAVATPDRSIGRAVTSYLLDAGADVVLMVRSPERVLKFAYRGAEVRLGSLNDATFVADATQGVDELMWITPPCTKAHDVREFVRKCGHAAQEAIRSNNIPRVVNISSVGAHLEGGSGLIEGFHEVENLLDEVSQNICHQRPGFLFENFLYELNSIRKDSCICYPISGHKRMPMVAARDVAQSACECLLDTSWTGRHYCAVLGPSDISFEDAAKQISLGIGKKIDYRQIDDDNMRNIMRGWGASDSFMNSLLETFRAVEWNRIHSNEPRTAENTTGTTLARFAQEVIAPLVREPVAAMV